MEPNYEKVSTSRKGKRIKLGIIDDHSVLRRGLEMMISDENKKRRSKYLYNVIVNVGNGADLIKYLEQGMLPDVVLLDTNMPVMDGFATAEVLKKNYPGIKILVFTEFENTRDADKMFKLGARGYILKDIKEEDFFSAVNTVYENEIYLKDELAKRLIKKVYRLQDQPLLDNVHLSDKEIEIIILLSTELSYREIADKMGLSPRTIDGYREVLFEKLKVKTRVGIVLYGIQKEIISI